MLAVAFLAQNLVPGMVFGSFGALLLASEAHLGTSRGTASLGLGVVLLAGALTGLAVASLIARLTLRITMLVGAVLSAFGYMALAFANSAGTMLAANALLVGPGIALCGIIPSNTLVCNWFRRGQGRMLGIVNMPVAVMIVPIMCVELLQSVGLSLTYLCLAAAFIPLIAAIFFISDAPPGADRAAAVDHNGSSARVLLRKPLFWLLVTASGLIVAGAITKSAHLSPLMIERGMGAERAALLLSIAGGTGVIGSPFFGWLAERLGGGFSLAVSAFVQGAAWFILVSAQAYELLVLDAVIVGACAGGYVVSTTVLIASLFGPGRFAQVYGLLSPLTLPFVFGAASAAGYLRDLTGSYTIPFLAHIAGFVAAGMLGLVLARSERAQRARVLAVA